MRCYCCQRTTALVRKVKLRPYRELDPTNPPPDSAAYKSYLEDITFRWSVICPGCYAALDNGIGVAEIDGRRWNIAGQSRGDKAATLNEEKYRRFQEQEEAKLGA